MAWLFQGTAHDAGGVMARSLRKEAPDHSASRHAETASLSNDPYAHDGGLAVADGAGAARAGRGDDRGLRALLLHVQPEPGGRSDVLRLGMSDRPAQSIDGRLRRATGDSRALEVGRVARWVRAARVDLDLPWPLDRSAARDDRIVDLRPRLGMELLPEGLSDRAVLLGRSDEAA